MIKLIATDMDETFLRSDKTYDVALFKRIAKRMQAQGMTLVIASGNSYDKLQESFDEEDLNWLYLAGDNGNCIVKGNKFLKINALDRQIVAQVLADMETREGYHCLLSTTKTSYILKEMRPEILDYFDRYNPEIIKVNTLHDIPMDESIVKFVIMSEHRLDTNKALLHELMKKHHGIRAVTSGGVWIDIYNKIGGKGSAVNYFQKKYGIKRSETMCFGDSLNDLSMMYETAFSMVMENGDEELKKVCRYEIDSNQQQGVLAILDKLTQKRHEQWLQQYRLPRRRYRLIEKMKRQQLR